MGKRNPMPEGRHEEVMYRARWACEATDLDHRCHGPLEVHHIVGRGMGGSSDPAIHDLDNLMAVCQRAHYWIEHNPAAARELGYRRHR